MTTTVAIVIFKAALLKLDECREKCPRVGGDIDASNLRWMIKNREVSESAALQAAGILESLARGLNVEASDEIDALRQVSKPITSNHVIAKVIA